MKKGIRLLAPMCAVSIIMAVGVVVALPQTNDLGIFTNEGSVGVTPPGCKAHSTRLKGEYTITGGGANMWAATDAFYFVWKKISGDISLPPTSSGLVQAPQSIARRCS